MKKALLGVNAAEEAELTTTVKEIVQRMFAAGDIEIEMDDAALKKDIATVRSDMSTSIRQLDADSKKAAAEIKKESAAFASGLASEIRPIIEGVIAFKKDFHEKLDRIERDGGKSAVTFDEAKIAAIADETFASMFTKIAATVAGGETTALPPLRKVDPFFVENEQTERIARAITQRRHLMASGPSGSGKTYPIEQMLRKFGRRYIKVSVADGLSMAEFLARANVRATKTGAETYYTYGFLPLTMKAGIPLVLDEVDQCQPEVVSIVNAAAENREIYIPQTGELVKAGKDWQIFMTCNSLRDSTGNYGGFRLNAALLNRLVFGKADYLKAGEERGILERVGLTAKDAGTIVSMFQGLRAAYFTGKLTQAPSTRIAVRIARCVLGQDDDGKACDKSMKLTEAFEYCFLDGLPDTEAKEALTVLKEGL